MGAFFYLIWIFRQIRGRSCADFFRGILVAFNSADVIYQFHPKDGKHEQQRPEPFMHI